MQGLFASPVATVPDEAPLRLLRETGRRRNLVSLTPLIDVVFILLVFFMLASNFFEWHELKLTTTVGELESGARGTGTHVELDTDGLLRLDGQPMPVGRACRILTRRLRENPELTVLLQPREGVTVQEMVVVFDRLVAAGATRLSLVTEPARPPETDIRDKRHWPGERRGGAGHRGRPGGS